MVKFFAISDLHITEKNGRATLQRKKAFDHLQMQAFDFGLLVGDVTNGGQKEEFSIATFETEGLSEKIPLLVSFGNHDYNANDPGEYASEDGRKSYFEQILSSLEQSGLIPEIADGKAYWSCRINEIQVICMDCAYAYPETRAGAEQLEWLDGKLSESDAERFRIVINHFPLTDRVPSYSGKKQISYIRDSKKISSILEKHGKVLYFCGHTHYTPDSDTPSVIYDEKSKVAYINTGSVGNTMPDASKLQKIKNKIKTETDPVIMQQLKYEYKQENTSGSTGILVDILSDKLCINGFDFNRCMHIEKCCFEIDM